MFDRGSSAGTQTGYPLSPRSAARDIRDAILIASAGCDEQMYVNVSLDSRTSCASRVAIASDTREIPASISRSPSRSPRAHVDTSPPRWTRTRPDSTIYTSDAGSPGVYRNCPDFRCNHPVAKSIRRTSGDNRDRIPTATVCSTSGCASTSTQNASRDNVATTAPVDVADAVSTDASRVSTASCPHMSPTCTVYSVLDPSESDSDPDRTTTSPLDGDSDRIVCPAVNVSVSSPSPGGGITDSGHPNSEANASLPVNIRPTSSSSPPTRPPEPSVSESGTTSSRVSPKYEYMVKNVTRASLSKITSRTCGTMTFDPGWSMAGVNDAMGMAHTVDASSAVAETDLNVDSRPARTSRNEMIDTSDCPGRTHLSSASPTSTRSFPDRTRYTWSSPSPTPNTSSPASTVSYRADATAASTADGGIAASRGSAPSIDASDCAGDRGVSVSDDSGGNGGDTALAPYPSSSSTRSVMFSALFGGGGTSVWYTNFLPSVPIVSAAAASVTSGYVVSPTE